MVQTCNGSELRDSFNRGEKTGVRSPIEAVRNLYKDNFIYDALKLKREPNKDR